MDKKKKRVSSCQLFGNEKNEGIAKKKRKIITKKIKTIQKKR
jgi:hypothetical protein